MFSCNIRPIENMHDHGQHTFLLYLSFRIISVISWIYKSNVSVSLMLNCHIRCISITLLAKAAFIKLLSTGTVKLPHFYQKLWIYIYTGMRLWLIIYVYIFRPTDNTAGMLPASTKVDINVQVLNNPHKGISFTLSLTAKYTVSLFCASKSLWAKRN